MQNPGGQTDGVHGTRVRVASDFHVRQRSSKSKSRLSWIGDAHNKAPFAESYLVTVSIGVGGRLVPLEIPLDSWGA